MSLQAGFKMDCEETLKKVHMKNRLVKWGSFFERLEEQCKNALSAEDTESEDYDSSQVFLDPSFVAVEKEHEEVRKSLLEEHGISAEELAEHAIEEAEEDLSDSLSNSSSSHVTDDSDCSLSNDEDIAKDRPLNKVSFIKSNDNRNETENKKYYVQNSFLKEDAKKTNYFIEMQGQHHEHISKSQQISDKNVDHKVDSSEDCLNGQPKKKNLSPGKENSCGIERAAKNENLKKKRTADEKGLSEVCDEQCRSINKVSRFSLASHSPHKSPLKNNENIMYHEVSVNHGKCSTSVKEDLEISQDDIPDSQHNQPCSKKVMGELYKQYDLWLLSQRRKSAQHGSLHIISSLDEDLSDKNRLVPDLDPEVKKPVFPPRRFSLNLTPIKPRK